MYFYVVKYVFVFQIHVSIISNSNVSCPYHVFDEGKKRFYYYLKIQLNINLQIQIQPIIPTVQGSSPNHYIKFNIYWLLFVREVFSIILHNLRISINTTATSSFHINKLSIKLRNKSEFYIMLNGHKDKPANNKATKTLP